MRFRLILMVVFIAVSPEVSFGQTLKEALAKKDTVTALQLIKSGADINEADNMGTSLLMNACRWADDTVVRFLLRHGATPDKPRSAKGRTALMVACAYYSGKGICSMLIATGADVNATAQDGTTALMLAAMNAKLDVVELLLKKGADPNAKDAKGKTVLEYAEKAEISEYITKAVKDTRIDKGGVVALLKKYIR